MRKEHDYDRLFDECAEIEINETIKGLVNKLSSRGVMAVEMLKVVHGSYYEEDDE